MSSATLPVWNGCNDPSVVFATGPDGAATARSIMSGAAQAASGITSIVTLGATATGIGAAIGGLVALGFAISNIFSGCGDTCTMATTYANAAEDKLNQIIDTWNNAPSPKPRSMQLAALTIVVGTFTALCKACGSGSLGDAGKRCIDERLIQGAPAPWCPTSTGCDWVTTYYLPIRNATDIVDDSQAVNNPPPGVIQPNYTQAMLGAATQPSQATIPTDNIAFYIVGALVLAALIKYRQAA